MTGGATFGRVGDDCSLKNEPIARITFPWGIDACLTIRLEPLVAGSKRNIPVSMWRASFVLSSAIRWWYSTPKMNSSAISPRFGTCAPIGENVSVSMKGLTFRMNSRSFPPAFGTAMTDRPLPIHVPSRSARGFSSFAVSSRAELARTGGSGGVYVDICTDPFE
ncbi:hypothetical protein WMF29_29980 [Sorangium sp. So ce381]